MKAFTDGIVIAKRNLIRNSRMPDVIVAGVMAPIMFVLLFAYVFGSAIKIPGMNYREFLMAGIFTQTILFGSAFSGSGLALDVQRGIVERFRTLPMSPSAVLVGRATSDMVTNIVVVVIMTLTGLLVGWRIRSSALEALGGFAVLLLFAYAMSWVWLVIGLLLRNQEVFNNASFIIIMPLTFIANTFVASSGLPGPLRVIAEWNPISAVTSAARQLFGNVAPQLAEGSAWPMREPVTAALLWIVVLLAVFVPLAVTRYRTAVSK